MLIDNPAEVRDGGSLLFLLEGEMLRAYRPGFSDGDKPAEVRALHEPSQLFNLLASPKEIPNHVLQEPASPPPVEKAPGESKIRAVFVSGTSLESCFDEAKKWIEPGDFVAFDDTIGNDLASEVRKQRLQALVDAIQSKNAKAVLLTKYPNLFATDEIGSAHGALAGHKNPNNAARDVALASGAQLCDVEYFFSATEQILTPWGASLLQQDGVTPNVFGNIGLAVLLYRCVVQDAAPDTSILEEALKRAWFYVRGANNVPLHFRADILLPILALTGDKARASNEHKPLVRNSLTRSRPDAGQYIQCVPMSRNGVHLLMGILSNLGAFCHFDRLDAHYVKRDGRLCLNGVGRDFVTTFATDMALYDERAEADIPLRVEFSHRLNDSLFKERWIRSVRDPRDMLVSIHDLAPIKKIDAKIAPIDETLEVPLPNAGGCVFGLGPIEEWALQESFLHHVLNKDQLCHVQFEKIKSDGLAEISRLLDFIGYEAEVAHITDALAANKVEAVRPYGKLSQSGGKIGHWRSREFATRLDERYSLAAQALHNAHDYSIGSFSPKPHLWPNDTFAAARSAWVTLALHNLKKRFPSSNYERFQGPLMNFTELAGSFPLLEIQLAEALLTKKHNAGHAMEVLLAWSSSHLWAPRFMALMALAKHDAEFKLRLENSLVESHSIWRRTKHPMIRQMAARMGFTDESALAVYDGLPVPAI